MAITRAEKEAQITLLADELGKINGAVFTDYRGLTVREITELRSKLREGGASYRVVKYTLLGQALKRAGIKVELGSLEGPLAVAFSTGDIAATSKTIVDFAREKEALQVNGGIFEGEWTEADTIKRLALLPSRDELYAKVVGSLNAPLSGLVGVLVNVPRGLVSVLQQYADSRS
jgi:large subunit ribosomal protein L10